MKNRAKLPDIFPDLIFIAGAVVLLVVSRSIPDPGFDLLGPAFLPQAILVGIIFFSAISLFAGLTQGSARANEKAQKSNSAADVDEASGKKAGSFASAAFLKSVGLIALLTGFIWSVTSQITRFEISGAIFLFAAMTWLSGTQKKHVIRNLLVSITLPFVIGMLFRNYLYVNLP